MCGIVFVGVGVGDGSDGEVLARGGVVIFCWWVDGLGG